MFVLLVVFGFIYYKKHNKLILKVLREYQKTIQVNCEEVNRFFTFQKGSGSVSFWLLLALIIGASIRGYFISQPMRGDEAYTFLNFANKGYSALFDYPVPNNHVLNTVLIKITMLIWGASPATIRLPAFLAGLATIPLTFYLARAQNPRKYSGILAAIATAVWPYLILYSTNARGYSLVTLLTLAITLVAIRFAQKSSLFDVILLSIFSALGMWSIPSMIFGVAGITSWLGTLLWLAKHPIKKIFTEFVIPYGTLSTVFTIFLYLPVMIVSKGANSIIANKFVESQSWPEFIAQILPKIQSSIFELTRDIHPSALIAILILGIIGLYFSYHERDWKTFLQLPCLFLGAMVILFAQHAIPYARLWIYTLPFIFILADYGFTFVLERLHPRIQFISNIAIAVTAIIFSVHLVSANVITKYPDTSAFPEAPIVAQYLKPILTKDDTVRVSNTADWSVFFYFWYYDVSYNKDNKQGVTGKTFIIVKKSRYSLEDMTNKPVLKLLDFEDMALYKEIEQ